MLTSRLLRSLPVLPARRLRCFSTPTKPAIPLPHHVAINASAYLFRDKIELNSLPIDIRSRIETVFGKAGFVPNIFIALAHRPDEFRAFFAYHDALMEQATQLSKAEKEMIVVATSSANNCQYCVVAHGAILRLYSKDTSISEKVSTNFHKANLSTKQVAMLSYAMKVSRESESITEDDHHYLRQLGYTDQSIWEIGAISAFFAMSNRLASMMNLLPNAEFFDMGRVFKPKSQSDKTDRTPPAHTALPHNANENKPIDIKSIDVKSLDIKSLEMKPARREIPDDFSITSLMLKPFQKHQTAPMAPVPVAESTPVQAQSIPHQQPQVQSQSQTKAEPDISRSSALSACPADAIQLSMKNGVAIVTLNRPSARNALSLGLLQRLNVILQHFVGMPLASSDSDFDYQHNDNQMIKESHQEFVERLKLNSLHRPRALLLRGNGTVFSSGHDLKEIKSFQDTNNVALVQHTFDECEKLMKLLQSSALPTVCEVTGIASAAGCQLAAACDVLICSEQSTFAAPGAKVGLFCTTPSVELLRNIPKKLALRMLYSADPISAHEALTGGLVSQVCADAAATHAAALKLTNQIAAFSPVVMQLGKTAVLKHSGKPVNEAYQIATQTMVSNITAQPDAKEGIAAFLGKRHPHWTKPL